MRVPAVIFATLAMGILALILLTGCAGYSSSRDIITWNPDGSIVQDKAHVAGSSLFTDKGIQKAHTPTMGDIEGYNANTNSEALRSTAEGLSTGLVKGFRAATLPTPLPIPAP